MGIHETVAVLTIHNAHARRQSDRTLTHGAHPLIVGVLYGLILNDSFRCNARPFRRVFLQEPVHVHSQGGRGVVFSQVGRSVPSITAPTQSMAVAAFRTTTSK